MTKAAVVVAKEGIAAQLKNNKPVKTTPTIISGSEQDPNDPNVIRGDSSGAWIGEEKPGRASWVTELLHGVRNVLMSRRK